MANEWPYFRIEDVAEKVAMGPFGSSIKVSTFVSDGIPVISGQHLHGVKVEDSEFNFITEDHAEKLSNSNVQRGDVIFTHAGNIGQVAYIPDTSRYARYVISQRQFYMRCNRAKVLPEFITYFFKTHEGQHKLLANRSSTGVPSIARPVTYLRSIEIPVPPLSVQRRIAHILGTLDDKIELNRRMNRTLEKMAAAIFKSWFIDFDPVRAKTEGQDTGLPEEIADLFPDSFEDSEIGLIPKGWTSISLVDMIQIIGGGTPKTSVNEYWGGSIPWFSVKDAPSESDVFVIDTEKHVTQCGLDNSSARILAPGTTIISARGTVGKCALVGRPMAMNQSCYGIQGGGGRGPYFTYYVIRSQISDLQRSGHGSVFNTITRDTFNSLSFCDPGAALSQAFDRVIGPLFQRILSNLYQSTVLARIRDCLLPKLLSGELEVPGAKVATEEVAG